MTVSLCEATNTDSKQPNFCYEIQGKSIKFYYISQEIDGRFIQCFEIDADVFFRKEQK